VSISGRTAQLTDQGARSRSSNSTSACSEIADLMLSLTFSILNGIKNKIAHNITPVNLHSFINIIGVSRWHGVQILSDFDWTRKLGQPIFRHIAAIANSALGRRFYFILSVPYTKVRTLTTLVTYDLHFCITVHTVMAYDAICCYRQMSPFWIYCCRRFGLSPFWPLVRTVRRYQYLYQYNALTTATQSVYILN